MKFAKPVFRQLAESENESRPLQTSEWIIITGIIVLVILLPLVWKYFH